MNLNCHNKLNVLFELILWARPQGVKWSNVLSCMGCVWLFVTLWTVPHQTSLSMGFSRQEYWSGSLCPSPGELPTQGLNLGPPQCRQILYHWATWEVPFWYESEGEVAQSCLTLCNPMDCSLPGSSVHGIFQTRILEWVAISFFRRSSQPRDQTQVSCIAGRFLYHWATLWHLSNAWKKLQMNQLISK